MSDKRQQSMLRTRWDRGLLVMVVCSLALHLLVLGVILRFAARHRDRDPGLMTAYTVDISDLPPLPRIGENRPPGAPDVALRGGDRRRNEPAKPPSPAKNPGPPRTPEPVQVAEKAVETPVAPPPTPPVPAVVPAPVEEKPAPVEKPDLAVQEPTPPARPVAQETPPPAPEKTVEAPPPVTPPQEEARAPAQTPPEKAPPPAPETTQKAVPEPEKPKEEPPADPVPALARAEPAKPKAEPPTPPAAPPKAQPKAAEKVKAPQPATDAKAAKTANGNPGREKAPPAGAAAKPAAAEAKATGPQPAAAAPTEPQKGGEAGSEDRYAAAIERVRQRAGGGGGGLGGTGDPTRAPSIGGAGVGSGNQVVGAEFLIYYNIIISRIKRAWVWVGHNDDLAVTVRFAITPEGEIQGVQLDRSSGDGAYDESVLRAVREANPLPPPPAAHRRDFSDVELTFRPGDFRETG